MFRSAIWAVRQPRYAALAALMLVVAALCVVAGTWQVSRFEQKVRDNDALRANAHAATVPLTTALVPLVGTGPAPGRDAIRYRTVTVSGTFVSGAERFVRNQSIDGTRGYYVLDPLRTADGTLLVVRGFVAQSDSGTVPAVHSPLPTGQVRLTGRLQTADTNDDKADELPTHQLDSVNPAQHARRLGTPVYDAYLTLKARQPGTAGLTALPAPNLSNPAGGAVEPQHLAYIVQWYLFALLALAAPFAVARHEVRDARERFLGLDPGSEQFDAPEPVDGTPQLPALGGSGGALAVRASGELARVGEPDAERWERAAQLADRYGRSLGRGHAAQGSAAPARRVRRTPPAEAPVRPNSTVTPHRSEDDFHGAYNDYLWELSMADGKIPQLDFASGDAPAPKPDVDGITPTVIDPKAGD